MPQMDLKRINISRTHVPDEEDGCHITSESAVWAGFYCYFVLLHMLELCPVGKKKKKPRVSQSFAFSCNVGRVRLHS